jgi:hypothetical protein
MIEKLGGERYNYLSAVACRKKGIGMKINAVIPAIFLLVCGFSTGLKGGFAMGRKHVVLLGASVGREWNISSLPERVGDQDYEFEYVGHSGFDKTDSLKKILSRDENKPDVIILKECAAYFPGDFAQYQDLIKNWIDSCRKEGVIPVPATVVPVTRLHSFKMILIDIIKGRNPFKRGNPLAHKRNASICAYNDWIRKFAAKEGLAVLDMEAAVRYSVENRFLREDFAKIDGLHINSMAYESLDWIVIPALKKAGGPR